MESLNPPIQSAVERYLSEVAGEQVAVVHATLLARRLAPVWRLVLQGGSADSLILKHVPESQYPLPGWEAASLEFREELHSYRFLNSLDVPGIARLQGFHESGWLLLQDLGTERQYLDDRDLVTGVATCLAQLHAATRTALPAYAALRPASALPADHLADLRQYGHAGNYALYIAGAHELFALARELGADLQDYDAEVNAIRAEVLAPGQFLSFIHDDLASGRQTAVYQNRLYLLDFENAKFGHCLLDILRPMMGKFEIQTATGEYFLNNPSFPPQLLLHYRNKWEALTGENIDEGRWREALEACALYMCLAQVGKLVAIPPAKLRGNPASNLQTILQQTLALLPYHTHFPSLRAVLTKVERSIGQSMFVPPMFQFN
jgi:hypothetical protein